MSRDQAFDDLPATEEQLNRLEVISRMLSRVEEVHAISWLWPSEGAGIGRAADVASKMLPATTTGTPLRMMLPRMRRRARRRRGMPLAAMPRWVVDVLVDLCHGDWCAHVPPPP